MRGYIYLRLGSKNFLQDYEKYKHLDDSCFDWVSPRGNELARHGRILEFQVGGKQMVLAPTDAKQFCDANEGRHIILSTTQGTSWYACCQIQNIKLRVQLEGEN